MVMAYLPHRRKAFRSTVEYTYFRLNVTSVSSGTAGFVYEFQVRESASDASTFLSGGTATASSTVAGSSPANAFDGNTATSHNAAAGVTSYTLTYQTAAKKTPRVVSLAPGNIGNFSVQVSNDGTTWTTLGSFTSGAELQSSGWQASQALWHYPLQQGEMWFLEITAVVSASTSAGFQEIELRETAGGANKLTGGLATASSFANAAPPANAVDGSTSTVWTSVGTNDPVSGGVRWGYILPFGTTISPVELRIKIGSSTNTAPKDFALKKWSNGTITTVKAWSGVTWTANENKLLSI